MSKRNGTTEARPEGFYWVILGMNPPVTVVSGRLVFKPRLPLVA
jgi:hypothetical protein